MNQKFPVLACRARTRKSEKILTIQISEKRTNTHFKTEKAAPKYIEAAFRI